MGLVENGVGFWFAFGRSCVFERNAVCMNSNVPLYTYNAYDEVVSCICLSSDSCKDWNNFFGLTLIQYMCAKTYLL